MRVIAGEKRHLLLKTLESLDIRPTTDKIKETLFNILQWDIPDSRFLDLFAGSGAIGIEALSRGAKIATFIDDNKEAIKIINDNLAHTGLIDRSKVIKSDAASYIYKLGAEGIKFDIIFLDPPYEDSSLYEKVAKAIKDSGIYDNNSIIIAEASKDFDNNIFVNQGYIIKKEKIYKSNKHLFMNII